MATNAEKAALPSVELSEVKGRAMLNWVGKRPPHAIVPRPAQHMETFDPTGSLKTDSATSDPNWPTAYPKGGLMFYGDNREVLANLLANGFRSKVNLIYIDPPFDSGADYVRKVQLRGLTGLATLEGEGQSLVEQVQYEDIWANDSYLQFMYERLILLKELLNENGFVALHLNASRVHYIKCLMDEVFEDANFRNEIIVKRIRKSYSESAGIFSLNEGCDYILLYSKGSSSRLKLSTKYSPKEERWHGFDAPNIRLNLAYELFGKMPPPKRHWMRTQEEAEKLIADGNLRPNPNTGWPEYRLGATEYIGRDTLWDDITASAFTTGYPTEKKEELIKLFVEMTTNPGDLVLDCFMGSGTTVAVAQKLGRRWIGCDLNKGALQTASKRLQNIILEQSAVAAKPKQNGFMEMTQIPANGDKPAPAQLAFTIQRVNDYDLKIQHNEAVALVCEQIGIERIKTDAFFDGKLGDKLVKIVPLDHPLSPLDLEGVKRELEARQGQEMRTVVMVSLGKMHAADDWLLDWNKRRAVVRLNDLNQPIDFINKIETIDLRTDPKYGGFMRHTPADAAVHITRQGDQLEIQVETFISATIVKRLNMEQTLFQTRVTDWRAMVASIEIDTAYDGQVFNIMWSDIPEKRTDLVKGSYKLPAPSANPTTVAVKLVDMLGEEVLKTALV